MSASICLAVVLVFLWALPAGTQRAHPERSARGCSDAGLCCPRRDMRCASQGRRTDGSLGPCFCDAACSRVGDCCADYDDTCPASLCKVSQWSHWSGCALPCSPSYRERVRSVLQHPRGSAPECPALRQRAVCMTDHSLSGLPCSFSLLPAAVTSAEFTREDISKPYELRPQWQEYCVEFEVLSMSPVCGWAIAARQHTRWILYLHPGVNVCVHCEPQARRGQGGGQCHGDGHAAPSQMPLWWHTPGTAGCQGLWRRPHDSNGCNCPPQHTLLFV
uniref:somatomedin-B and thrombospondin type-1 domain-containing protein-like isoform X2 n=1 Tax=Myxine glutinosa TaxID=7769 RepID=UPI00358EE469